METSALGRATDRDGHTRPSTHPIPALECPSRRFPESPRISQLHTDRRPRRKETVFVELMPLLKERTLLITVARVDERVKVNVIPAKVKEGEDHALTTPLSLTRSAEELDSELGRHIASYVDSHLALGNTLAEAKAEMDAAAKAARQKVKTTQQASKVDPAVAKKDESPGPAASAADETPSLFAAQQDAEPTTQAAGQEGRKATS